jgi:hypothetical protein
MKLSHVNVIKWEDESGRVQQFNLTKKIAHRWRTIGKLLGLTNSELQSIDDKHRRWFKSRPEECCQAVLKLWLDNPPLDPDYPATWQGLIKVFEDSKLGEVAIELRTVLSKAVDL